MATKREPLAQLQDSINQIFGFRAPRAARSVVVQAAQVEEQRLSRNAMAKARRLAAKHGIELERDDGAYWVTCSKFEEGEDPCEGAHFCEGGVEVLQAVEAYVQAIEARAA